MRSRSPAVSASPRRRLAWLVGGLALLAFVAGSHWHQRSFGRADNGDFVRYGREFASRPVGFRAEWPQPNEPDAELRFWNSWIPLWIRSDDRPTQEATEAGSSKWLWSIGVWLNDRFADDRFVDLKWLGLPARLVMLASFAYLICVAARDFGPRIGALLLLVPMALPLSEVGYASFFNSFYREGAALSFTLLMTVALVGMTPRSFWFSSVTFAAAGALLALSAPAHSSVALLAGVALCAAAVRLLGRDARRGWPARAGLAGLIVGLMAAAWTGASTIERAVREKAAFHSVFNGALLVSEAPLSRLDEVGLSGEADLLGRNAWSPAVSGFLDRADIDHGLLLRILWQEPEIAPRMVQQAANAMNDLDVSYLAMAQHGDASAPREPGRRWWRDIKSVFPDGLPLLLVLVLVGGFAGLLLRHRDDRVFAIGLAICLAATSSLVEMVVSAFGDGFSELGRHLLVANFQLDLATTLLPWAAYLAYVRSARQASASPRDAAAPHPRLSARARLTEPLRAFRRAQTRAHSASSARRRA